MTAPTKLDKVVADEILAVIRTKFDLDDASNIEVTSIEVDQDELKIRIELLITTTERPEMLAKSYFGLTGKVREALGSDWSGFFPVITPQINSGMHA
ncbi:hypothetical protein DFP92_106125 [Yoonia sediminilitoris]|uniref:Uncharacterized protein n=2 Tax=Yoonia sediminilitoris TaxID=1286148 RepID=A0A2T6KG11_9RHOB|nr:hypothetical protein C8N45_106125 [Yoonia sediminilitoris]RCW95182.1 hypothetical protein DFP92_106125 [Yoonia sediminilitoris]